MSVGKWVPISDKHPLCTCKHYVGLCHTGVLLESEDTSTVDGFYGELGEVVISTVGDGDCGLDVMLHMLGENSTFIARTQLRDAIADYIALDNPSAAQELVQRVFRHMAQLEQHPESGSKPKELKGWRYRQIVEPPCRIIYRYEDDQVFILHIMRSEQRLRRSKLRRV